MRHDEPKEIFASFAKQVFRDVEVEPDLEPLTGEEMKYKSANVQDDARSDVRIRGFWGKTRNAFFDFRAYYAFASS